MATKSRQRNQSVAPAKRQSVFPLVNPFPLVDTNYFKENFGLSEKDISDIRKSLPAPTYWLQRKRKISYNLRLWEHYIRCVIHGSQADRQNHDRLLEYYGTYCDGLLDGAKDFDSDQFLDVESYLQFIKEKLSG